MNDKNMSFEIGSETGFVLPNRIFIIITLLTLFMVIVLSTGWSNMLLFYLAFLIVFFIFFEVTPYKETFASEYQQVNNNPVKLDCNKHKLDALDNINKYMKCKNEVKPRVICPDTFKSIDDITEHAREKGDLIQDPEYLKQKQPNSVDRVCGIIPGIAAQRPEIKKEKLLTDEELKTLLKHDITLHQVKEDLENKLIADPLDLDVQKKLNIVEHEIIKLKPNIVYNLRAKNKTVDFVKNALM